MSVNSFDDYPMSWRPDITGAAGPKYLALAELLEEDIKNGVLKAGTRLPPQRELADFLDVNLSTVFRAFKLCEQKGLLSASVGSGTFVSSDVAVDSILLCGNEDTHMIEMGAIVPLVASNDRVKQYMERLLKKPDALQLFSYGAPEGTERHRAAGAAWFKRSGLETDKSHIVLAAGGQNGITASLAACFRSGDRVGTDPLTYPGVKTAAKLLGIQLVPIQNHNYEMTEEGIRYALQNENIKGIYVVPDYHNPTTHTMSLETRKMIAGLAKEKNLPVIEDGINNLLTDRPLPPIAAFAPEQVICLSSLSKTVSPGLRTAFVHVPEQYHQSLSATLYSMNIAISPLLATLSAGLIEEGAADEILKERKEQITKRNQVVNEILEDFPVAGELTSPLRYLYLPERFSGKDFETCARNADVQVYGAERFSIGNKPVERAVRLSIITPPAIEELAEGLLRLKKILRQ